MLAIAALTLLADPSSAYAVTPAQLKRVEQLHNSVEELFREGNHKQAVPLLEEIISITPNDRTALRYLAVANRMIVEPFCRQAEEAFMKGEYEAAIEEWQRILQINPEDTGVDKMIKLARNLIQENILKSMYSLAQEFIKQGDNVSAANELEKILEIDPHEMRAKEMLISVRQNLTTTMIQVHYDTAEAFMKEEQYDLAIAEWKQILEIDSSQEEASRLMAMALRKRLDSMYAGARQAYEDGDYLTSLSEYSKLMAGNPTDTDLKKIVGKLNETVKVVQKLEGEGEAYDMLRKALSNYIAVDGNPKVAIAAAWYAEQLDPNSEFPQIVRSFLERKHLMVYRSMEPPIKDMNLIDQYLFAALNNIYEGRYDLAVQEAQIVLALQPENVLALKRLGSAFYALGDEAKARQMWEKALKLTPGDNELKMFLRQLRS